MRFALAILLALFALTSCSSESVTQIDEQTFISGNGIVTTIDVKDREFVPVVSGPTLDGGIFAAPSGKVNVINVWASWCAPCRAEAPALQELSIKHPDTQFIGILTRDNLVAAQAFVDRFGLTYPTITDDATLANFSGLLSVNAIPTTLIIDKDGRLAARISGEITFSSMDELLTRISNE